MTNMEREYDTLLMERNGDADYTLRGLPADTDADFRDADSYETVQASSLFVNGVGFSAPAAEFSQHGVTVTVEQDTEGGSANIKL